MLPPSSESENKPRKNQQEEVDSSSAALASCLTYSLTLKMETCSSKTSVNLQWTIWCYIPEDRNLIISSLLLQPERVYPAVLLVNCTFADINLPSLVLLTVHDSLPHTIYCGIYTLICGESVNCGHC
jgi:hypothetical protein